MRIGTIERSKVNRTKDVDAFEIKYRPETNFNRLMFNFLFELNERERKKRDLIRIHESELKYI
jgi:hypothetical protein